MSSLNCKSSFIHLSQCHSSYANACCWFCGNSALANWNLLFSILCRIQKYQNTLYQNYFVLSNKHTHRYLYNIVTSVLVWKRKTLKSFWTFLSVSSLSHPSAAALSLARDIPTAHPQKSFQEIVYFLHSKVRNTILKLSSR